PSPLPDLLDEAVAQVLRYVGRVLRGGRYPLSHAALHRTQSGDLVVDAVVDHAAAVPHDGVVMRPLRQPLERLQPVVRALSDAAGECAEATDVVPDGYVAESLLLVVRAAEPDRVATRADDSVVHEHLMRGRREDAAAGAE